MDDFDLILGMGFLEEKGSILIPSTRSLLIMGKKLVMVPVKVKQSTELKAIVYVTIQERHETVIANFCGGPCSIRRRGRRAHPSRN